MVRLAVGLVELKNRTSFCLASTVKLLHDTVEPLGIRCAYEIEANRQLFRFLKIRLDANAVLSFFEIAFYNNHTPSLNHPA